MNVTSDLFSHDVKPINSCRIELTISTLAIFSFPIEVCNVTVLFDHFFFFFTKQSRTKIVYLNVGQTNRGSKKKKKIPD